MVVAAVWVRVFNRGFPVGCPTRMANAAVALQASPVVGHFIEFFESAFCLDNLDLTAAFAHGKPRRIIAAIFEFGQSFQQQRRRLIHTAVTNDSAHNLSCYPIKQMDGSIR